MLVTVHWTQLHGDSDSLWRADMCLYAYLHPARDTLLYIGKADYQTVRQREYGDHKSRVFRDISREYRIEQARVLQGDLSLPDGNKRSSALLADVETLLITRLKPYGNIQARATRTSRPGLLVECLGDWPFKRVRFRDV